MVRYLRNEINSLPERLGAHGGELQRGRGGVDFHIEKIILVRQRARRYDGSRGGRRDKVSDREEGRAREAATETRSTSTTGTGECEKHFIATSCVTRNDIKMIYRFVDDKTVL